jgi:hypothetical protein
MNWTQIVSAISALMIVVRGEERRDRGNHPHHEQRDVGETQRLVQLAERPEEHAVPSRVEREPRGAEQAGIDGGEGRDQDQDGHGDGGRAAPGGGHDVRADELRVHDGLDRHHAQDPDVHGQVDAHDAEDRQDDGLRHDPAWLLDLIAHIGHGEVPEEVIDRDDQARTQPDGERS